LLNTEQIKSIIESGEGYNAEFKVRVPGKLKELSEEVCAFANAAGGVLVLGVDDRNTIQGVAIDNAKRSAIQHALSEISPPLPFELYAIEVEGRTLWIIEVNSGTQKPYVLSGAIYVRQGPNTQKLTTVEQMRDFFQQSGRIYFDEAPCKGFDLEKDIEPEWFEEFRIDAGLSKAIGMKQVVQNLKLVNPNGMIKNGGVLFLGKQPEAFIETAVVRCVAFNGLTKTHIFDDKFFGGPLVKQYQQAMQWLKGKLNIRYEIEGAGPRKEHWEIPETALKEAIINALAHRDYYDKGARITIELYDDRIEISNPGGLSSAIHPKEFGTRSHSRNPLIFGLFVRIRLVEQVGSGIGRMKNAMQAAKLPLPEFSTDGIFTVTLKRATVEETVGETVEETVELILKSMKINPKVTTRELEAITGLSRRGIEYHLDKLKKNKLIERIGPTKGGTWKILKK